jgi:hypothetical protein
MRPKHHKASFFLKAELFDNLSSFAQLEERISELPTTVEEGDAFEVFAEALNPTTIIPIHTLSPERFSEYFGSKARILSDGKPTEL